MCRSTTLFVDMTPNMTLGRAASLFETYNPPSGPAAVPTTPTVNAVTCRYCRENTINCQIAQRKSQFPIRRGLKNPIRLHQLSPVQLYARDSRVLSVILWITCLTCALVVRKSSDVNNNVFYLVMHYIISGYTNMIFLNFPSSLLFFELV